MKVFEILRNDVSVVTEQQIIERLKSFDWKYEWSEDTRKIKRAEKELELLENMVYILWKSNPDRAIEIWNNNSPGLAGKTVVPSFIHRLEYQEK